MLLASAVQLREALGFDDMVNISEAIQGALHAAEPYLAVTLGTEFSRTSRRDVFYVREPHVDGALVLTELRLRRGFVDPEGFSVVMADTAQTLPPVGQNGGTSPPITEMTAAVELQADLGQVVDYRTNYVRKFLAVSYAAGFAVDPNNTASYALDQVPAWLQEAAKLKALITLETHPSMKDAGIKQDTRFLQAQLATILRGHLRYMPSAILPL